MAQSLEETLKERAARYGDFYDHARCSQALQGIIVREIQRRGIHDLPEVVREGLQMVCHKLARIATGDPLYRDSWHDIAGYATIVEERLPTRDEEVPLHDAKRQTPDLTRANTQPTGPGDTAGPGLSPGQSQSTCQCGCYTCEQARLRKREMAQRDRLDTDGSHR